MNPHQHQVSIPFGKGRSRKLTQHKSKGKALLKASRENSSAILKSNRMKTSFERCMICQRMLIDNAITSQIGQVSRNGSHTGTITSPRSPLFITAKVFRFLMTKREGGFVCCIIFYELAALMPI